MAREAILVVDDGPVTLKLTRVVLAGAGYNVRTATDAEQALDIVHSFRPRLILTGIRLPGMDGLNLTRQIKSDTATRTTLVIALTGCAAKEDERRALSAGCDGYIVKPFDARSLVERIKAYLEQAGPKPKLETIRAAPGVANGALTPAGPPSAPTAPSGVLAPAALPSAPRKSNGALAAATLPSAPAAPNDALASTALPSAPQPARTPQPSSCAPEPLRMPQQQPQRSTRQSTVPEGQPASPDPIFGKRCALAGVSREMAADLATLLERERAFSLVLSLAEVEASPALLDSCDLVILQLSSESAWLKDNLGKLARPVLLLASAAQVAEFESVLRNRPHELLISPWQPEEALLRARMAILRGAPGAGGGGRPRIVLADEDATTSALLKTVLQNYGMECREARDGGEAMELIRTFAPDAAILDVSMPNLDGLQVLSLLKSDPATSATRVIFLTARQQEADIVKAFALGAEDYITKPFNPMELVARLKRILRRET